MPTSAEDTFAAHVGDGLFLETWGAGSRRASGEGLRACRRFGRADDQPTLPSEERIGDARRVTGRRNEGEAVRREEGPSDLGGVGGLLSWWTHSRCPTSTSALTELGDQSRDPAKLKRLPTSG